MWSGGNDANTKEREPLLPKAEYKMTDVSADRGKQRSAGSASASDDKKQDYGTHYDALYKGVDRRALMNTGADGLTSEESSYRLEKFGRNELVEKKVDKWKKLYLEFTRPMALMVWGAVMIETFEAIFESSSYWADVIVLIILQLVNVFVGWSEELKACNAVSALKKNLQLHATCKRDGKWKNILAAELVPGDRVLVAAGA
eukprot:CAMPEP_0118935400 /NCGR_PEP_ID=MMETSP1169-20130426/15623_1 /TAXON_ID=36882 /ORGANISM="Pyramimonas obovata, Strain CCMP722" /LENGTH=200 /DNA_ID=CAMNT_0006878437 /DNA_START=298 /DNA_END=897 /DNA_ORIENTATION=-